MGGNGTGVFFPPEYTHRAPVVNRGTPLD